MNKNTLKILHHLTSHNLIKTIRSGLFKHKITGRIIHLREQNNSPHFLYSDGGYAFDKDGFIEIYDDIQQQ